MTRRRKTSPAKDLVDIVALLPWWAGVAMAALAYPLLRGIATQQTVVTGQPGPITSAALQSVLKGLATVGQYIVPLIGLVGAGVSAWRRRTRQRLVLDVAQSQASDALDGMTWREFEWLVGEGFRLRGYRVVESGGGGPDGGVDLVLTQGGEKFLVQCKQWRAFKVGVDVVRELYGVMAAAGCYRRFRRDLRPIHGRRQHVCERPQHHADGRAGTGRFDQTGPVDDGRPAPAVGQHHPDGCAARFIRGAGLPDLRPGVVSKPAPRRLTLAAAR